MKIDFADSSKFLELKICFEFNKNAEEVTYITRNLNLKVSSGGIQSSGPHIIVFNQAKYSCLELNSFNFIVKWTARGYEGRTVGGVMLGKMSEELKKWNRGWKQNNALRCQILLRTRKQLLELWLYDMCQPVMIHTAFLA